MLFNSFEFLLFFPVVTLLYFLLPHKVRWLHLLVASCVFYMAFIPAYILIIFLLVAIDYITALFIEKAEGTRRKWWLAISITANVGLLAFFKYHNFFADSLHLAPHYSSTLTRLILPVGLSFHTFQAMSYTIEVYRGNQRAERHLGIYALYILFYPQLVAGPIERPQNMLHQFRERHTFNYEQVTAGLRLMLWGLFKKVVIADSIAALIDPVYSDPQRYTPVSILVTSILFAYQMYCDFSGYSDIAIGAAQVMGYKLMVNFDLPFRSKSITEFWRRWHISLSTWFYDYVFNPIITTLRYWGTASIVIGLLITFFLSGAWHGAGWQFVVFGMIHGVALIYEYLTRNVRKQLFSRLPQALNTIISRLLTMSYVIFAWLFFRAHGLGKARLLAAKLLSLARHPGAASHAVGKNLLASQRSEVLYCFLLIALLEAAHRIRGERAIGTFFAMQSKAIRWSMYLILIFSIFLLGTFNNRQFIYFQF